MKKILTIILSGLTLAACSQTILVVGQPSAAIQSEDVVIYYPERPACNFETVAHIDIEGGYFSLESMFENMREEAANLGASGLYVLQTQRLPLKEYLGTAKAIRCLSA